MNSWNIKSAEYKYEHDQKHTVEVELNSGIHLSVMISDDNYMWKELQEWEKIDGNTITDNGGD